MGQKVRDMFYRSNETPRVLNVYPDNCAFPCRAIDSQYQSLELGSVNKPCPNPVSKDYDLKHDIASGVLEQKACDPTEVSFKQSEN